MPTSRGCVAQSRACRTKGQRSQASCNILRHICCNYCPKPQAQVTIRCTRYTTCMLYRGAITSSNMLWVYYLLPCKPFFKFSVLSLQVQAGIKCSLPSSYRGLSNWKLNINHNHFSSFSFGSIEDVVDRIDIYNQSIDPFEEQSRFFVTMSQQPEQHTVSFDETKPCKSSHVEDVQDISINNDINSPTAPLGYALYEYQRLKKSAWLPGSITPNFHIIDGHRYVRIEDISNACVFTPSTPTSASSNTSQDSSRDPRLYRCPEGETTPLEFIIHEALVRRYTYTGDYDADHRALTMYLQRYDQALKTLDSFPCRTRAENIEKLNSRQTIRRARDKLKDEFTVFRRDSVGNQGDEVDAYHGFDEFDFGLPNLPKWRPKGYKWVCR